MNPLAVLRPGPIMGHSGLTAPAALPYGSGERWSLNRTWWFMADEHIKGPPQQSPPPAVPPANRPGDPITAQPPAPGPNGELMRPAPAPAAAPARPSLGRTLLELVWPSTGAHVAQTDSIREVVETVVFVVVLVLLL